MSSFIITLTVFCLSVFRDIHTVLLTHIYLVNKSHRCDFFLQKGSEPSLVQPNLILRLRDVEGAKDRRCLYRKIED